MQLQYIYWPDHGVPNTPKALLKVCNRANEICAKQRLNYSSAGQVVVHCSAGVGRTGTFIAIDRALQRYSDAFESFSRRSRQRVDVSEIKHLVRNLKRDRTHMVQTAEQYFFIHQAVLEGLKNMGQRH